MGFTRDEITFPVIVALCLYVIDVSASTAEAMNDRLATQMSFDIPSQPLRTALKALADQAGIQILFEERVVRGRDAPAIKARQTPAQALNVLLSNTNLEFTAKKETVAVRERTPSPPATPTSTLVQNKRIAGVAGTTIEQTQNQLQERRATIEEVIVTAERREASAQRSSISIQVINGDRLKQVSRPGDLTAVVPGMQVGVGAVHPQIYIRGVGDNVGNSRGVGAVSFNVDGVHLPRGSAATTQFFDLARIEVLKGPQGTLYGRNASGGAINLITARPKLGEFEAFFEGSLGNYGLHSGEGMVNIPAGKTLAIRLSGQFIDREGYLSDGAQDQKIKSGRLRVLWEPSSQFSLLLNSDISHIGGQGTGNVVLNQNTDPWRSNTQQPLLYPFLFGPGTLPYTTPNDRSLDSDIAGVSAELNADLGFATLTVLPAYRQQDHLAITYGSNFRVSESLDSRQASIETRLGRSTENYNWVAGVFYYHDRFDIIDATQQNNLLARLMKPTIASKAIFGQASVTASPGIRMIGGVRYTEEDQYGTHSTGTAALPLVPFTPTTPITSFAVEATRINWKVGAEYDIAPASMLYATVSTGFKAGGYQPTTACGTNYFQPEDLKAYEVGIKNRFLGDTLQVNLEAFLWDYTNQQVSYVGEDTCGSRAFLTQNVGESTTKGGSIDVVWRATRNDTIRGYVEYADGKYDKFSFNQFGAGVYTPGQGSLCSVTALGGGFFRPDCSGLPGIRLPKWVAQVGYEHVFELGGFGTLTPSISGQYASKRWLDIGYAPNGLADSYEVINARISYGSPDEKWRVTTFIDNVFNSEVYTQGGSVNTLDPAGRRYYTGSINPPRMYGLRVRVNF